MIRILLIIYCLIYLFSFKTFSQESDTNVRYTSNYTFYLDLVGKPSPKWKLKDLDGKVYESDDYVGNLVLLEIWGTNCSVCIKTAEDVCYIDSLFNPDGLKVIGIEGDGRSTTEQIKKFKHDFNLNYFTLVGNKEISRQYGVIGYPTFFLIDKKGKIIHTSIGRIVGEKKSNLIKLIQMHL
jgi:peroxiredoxin